MRWRLDWSWRRVARTGSGVDASTAPDAPSTDQARKHRPTVQAFAWCAVVSTLAVTAVSEVPGQARQFRSDVEVGSGRSRLYRELQPARTVGLTDLRLFLTAERTIPLDATFFVATGPEAPIKDPLILRWVQRFALYRLLPRRLVERAGDADWIVSYGSELPPPGIRVGRVITVSPGVWLAEVASP